MSNFKFSANLKGPFPSGLPSYNLLKKGEDLVVEFLVPGMYTQNISINVNETGSSEQSTFEINVKSPSAQEFPDILNEDSVI